MSGISGLCVRACFAYRLCGKLGAISFSSRCKSGCFEGAGGPASLGEDELFRNQQAVRFYTARPEPVVMLRVVPHARHRCGTEEAPIQQNWVRGQRSVLVGLGCSTCVAIVSSKTSVLSLLEKKNFDSALCIADRVSCQRGKSNRAR